MNSNREMTCAIIAVLTLAAVSAQAEDRKPVILTAAELAPESQRSEEPTAGKWWLKSGVEGVPGNALLLTGKVNEGPLPKENLTEWGVVPAEYYTTAARVPALDIAPKLKGWYRIQLGMLHLSRHDNGY